VGGEGKGGAWEEGLIWITRCFIINWKRISAGEGVTRTLGGRRDQQNLPEKKHLKSCIKLLVNHRKKLDPRS